MNGSSSAPFPSLLAWTILRIVSLIYCRLRWYSVSRSPSGSGGPCAIRSLGGGGGGKETQHQLCSCHRLLPLSSFHPPPSPSLSLPFILALSLSPPHSLFSSPPSPSNICGSNLPISPPPQLPQTHPPGRSDRYRGSSLGMFPSQGAPSHQQQSLTNDPPSPEQSSQSEGNMTEGLSP